MTSDTNDLNARSTDSQKSLLEHLLRTEARIREYSKMEIVASPPLITMGDIPIIARGTVNVIQGKQGCHKSRLAEHFASLLIADQQPAMHSIGFTKIPNETVTVVYVDTERSVKEEFSMAVQKMRTNAGFSKSSDVPNFRFPSLKTVSRADRLKSLREFVEKIRTETSNPIFIIVDVATDAIRDFNDQVESMELLDFLGNMCEEIDTTALLIIHENPGSDKARGHLGTEAVNKSATVMQIGFEKMNDEHGSVYLTLRFVKQRHSQRLKPIPLHFDKETRTLKLANQAAFEAALLEKEKKVTASQIAPFLSELDGKEFRQKELLALIRERFGCSGNTAKARLEEIAERKIEIIGESCEPCFLTKKASSGSPTIYELLNYKEAS